MPRNGTCNDHNKINLRPMRERRRSEVDEEHLMDNQQSEYVCVNVKIKKILAIIIE